MTSTLSIREAQSPNRNPSDVAAGRYEAPYDDAQHAMPSKDALSILPRDVQYDMLERHIGWTPLTSVGELGVHRQISQKLEYQNPSGSHYDRAYIANIRQLENSGLISRGVQLRDITSGSAGISLAFLGLYLGYPVRITVPDELPQSRVLPAIESGAQVVRAGSGYIQAAHEFQKREMVELIRDGWKRKKSADPDMKAVVFEKDNQQICYLNHSENLATPNAFQRIGHEIIAQSGYQNEASAIVLALGNFTTVRGIRDSVHDIWPNTQIVGYDGGQRTIHDNYGTAVAGFHTRFMDETLLDARFTVSDQQRDIMGERINTNRPKEHKVGHSSLMGLVVADLLASELGGPIICIGYDRAERY